MICSIDPAFKKCAIVLIDPHTSTIIHAENHSFVSPDKSKTNQTQYTLDLWHAIHTKISQINHDYSPDCWVIEAQIG
jgi:Holliday junction resolvasome RuvABC endonuclease subunit